MAKIDTAQTPPAENPTDLLARAETLRLDNPAQSRAFAERALVLAEAVDDRAARAKAHQLIGIGSFHQGEYQRALAEEQVGAALFAALGDAREEAICLTWEGNCYAVRLDQALALDAYGRSLDLLRTVADRENIAYLMNNVALLHANTGREAEALAAFNEARPLARDLDDQEPYLLITANAAYVQARLGKQRAAAGDRATAKELCRVAIMLIEECLPVFEERQQHLRIVQSLAILGEAYHGLGDYARALEHLHQAQAIHQQVGERRHAAIMLGLIGEVYLAQRQFDLAIPQLTAAIEATAALGLKNETARTTYLLSQAYEERGDFAQALATFKRAVAIDLDVRTETADHHAHLLLTQHNLDHAQDEAALWERWSAEIATLKDQLRDRDDQLRDQAALLAHYIGTER